MRKTSTVDAQTEQLVIEQAQTGCPEAFGKLVRIYSSQIYRVSVKILRNHADAEDNVQNAFWKAYQNISRFQGRSRFSSWLIRIAINEALMKIRGRSSEAVFPQIQRSEGGELPTQEVSDNRPDPEQRYIARDLAAKAFRGLPKPLVEVFIRNKAEGCTQRELADELGITTSALKIRMFHARELMQKRLRAAAERRPALFMTRTARLHQL